MHYSVFVCQTDLKICIYPTVYLPKVKEKSKTFVQHSVSVYDKFSKSTSLAASAS